MTKKPKTFVRPIVVIRKGQKFHLSEVCDGKHLSAVFREIIAEIKAEEAH